MADLARERTACAELKAAEIEQDIFQEKFDTTLEKYQSAGDREKITLV